MKIISHMTIMACLCLSMLTATISAQANVKDALALAMSDESRSDAEKARDANRKPVETLEFFGLNNNMRVLELIPGGGWYTKLLAPVLADEGKLFVAVGTQGIQKLQEGNQLQGVEIIDVDMSKFVRPDGGRRFEVPGLTIDVDDIDMVLTFRNLHNITPAGRASMNKAAFDALKSGGIYGVVDHTRRHMQADNSENWRRMDPVLMIKEIEAAGFEFDDYSDLHYRYDDELNYEVGRRSVKGNTDRFTLKFRKP